MPVKRSYSCFVGPYVPLVKAYEPVSIFDENLAALRLDEVRGLQNLLRHSDARTANAEHHRKKLMGDKKAIMIGAIINHEIAPTAPSA